MVVGGEEEPVQSRPAALHAARTLHAQAIGEVAGTEKYARRALDLLPEGDYFQRAIPTGVLGLAYWASGDLEAAHRLIADANVKIRKTGNIAIAISGTCILADIRMAQGRLHEAVSIYKRSLQLATEQGEPVLRGTADLYLGFSELHVEQGDLEAAKQHLLPSAHLGEQAAKDASQ